MSDKDLCPVCSGPLQEETPFTTIDKVRVCQSCFESWLRLRKWFGKKGIV